MYIAIYVPGMPFNGGTLGKGASLGGSETAAYYMAKELAAIGHNVLIFTADNTPGTWDGVRYEFIGNRTQQTPLGDRFHYIMQSPHDVLIVQRHPQAFLYSFNTKLNIWWLHDLALHRNSGHVQPQLINIDNIFTVSEFHKEQVSKVYDINKDFIYATKNGINYNNPVFKEDINRIPRSLFYAARPERGLENLVGKDGIMEQLKNCHLYVAGYDNTTQQMASYYNYLWGRCAELPNVTNLGHLGKDELYRWLKKSMAYVYPSTFEETSCIMAMETQACGTPFVGCNMGALSETLFNGGAILVKNKKTGLNKHKFVHTVNWLLDHQTEWEKLHGQTKNIFQPWPVIARNWSERFDKLLAKKCEDKEKLYSHFEHTSDIVAMTKAGATEDNYSSLRDNYGFFLDNNYKDHYQAYYQYEKDRGVNYGPEDLSGNKRFEATLQLIKRLKPSRILDYGCAHGHYVINLAKRLPDVEIVGVDLEQTNIDKAIAWAEAEGLSDRCKFLCGGSDNLVELQLINPIKRNRFDIIIAAEVLEHVPNPQNVIEKLKPYLNEIYENEKWQTLGTFIISTPYGPWEAIGYDEHKGWRAHIHHFERQDLLEMFGKQKDYRLLSLPHGGDLGHYLVTFTPNDTPLGAIDYERKIKTQSPRESLTVTMIAKNEEDSIGKTLRSVKKVADEIIVGIDKDSTDRTEEIALSFGAKIARIESPIKQGFDNARNEVIKGANCDWIMWIDADETFSQIENLPKYLRSNCYNAYGIKQHHYAAEPPALFKTDYPCRIFRNHIGAKFFGFVHEHPEIEMNKGIGKVIILPDVSIMHTGYSTERIRRARFHRNWPLMRKDRERYPDRTLGHYLWCRDLAHVNRYELERNGRVVTQDMVNNAKEAIETWRELIKKNNVRMIIDGLQFYSESVALLGNGIKYGISLNSAPGGQELKVDNNVIAGTFANTDDIKKLTDCILKNNIAVYDEEYY